MEIEFSVAELVAIYKYTDLVVPMGGREAELVCDLRRKIEAELVNLQPAQEGLEDGGEPEPAASPN